MKLFTFFILAACAVATAQAFRVSRQESNDAEDECCYPRPVEKKGRNLKKQLQKCSQLPIDDIPDFKLMQDDVKACKERKHKEQLEAAATSTTTTTPSPLEEAKETVNEFDADLPDESNETEGSDDSPAATSQDSMRAGRNHHGHGFGRRGGRPHGRGLCIQEAMEKRGWSSEGRVNYDKIIRSLDNANPSAQNWVPVIKEATTNCSAQTEDRENQFGCPHKRLTPEKRAWRCIINNSILKSPVFPQDDEYCQQLRAAHDKCLAQKGPIHFRWCGTPRGKKHHKKPVH